MIVITATELRNNMKKYLDLAQKEQVLVKYGHNKGAYALSTEHCMEPDEDLARAITMDELLEGVKEDIREMFKKQRH